MRVYVRVEDVEDVPLDISATDTVQSVKLRLLESIKNSKDTKLIERFGLLRHAHEDIQLTLEESVLEDIRSVGDYNFREDCSLEIVLLHKQHTPSSPLSHSDSELQQEPPSQLPSALGAFSDLPLEMVIHVMSFLPFEDLMVNIARLNKGWLLPAIQNDLLQLMSLLGCISRTIL